MRFFTEFIPAFSGNQNNNVVPIAIGMQRSHFSGLCGIRNGQSCNKFVPLQCLPVRRLWRAPDHHFVQGVLTVKLRLPVSAETEMGKGLVGLSHLVDILPGEHGVAFAFVGGQEFIRQPDVEGFAFLLADCIEYPPDSQT